MHPQYSSIADLPPVTAGESPQLPLDEGSIAIEELSLPTLMRELNLQQRPNWFLRKLMNVLEQKRQAKGLGWSRAWNKYGLNVFRTHTQDARRDPDYFALLKPVLAELLPQAPAPYAGFARDLLTDPALLTFTFYHNHQDETGQQHEGLTLSFGRKITTDPSKRDRLDLILEDRRVNGRVDGKIDRLRLYVCPWAQYQHEKNHYRSEQTGQALAILTPAQDLYEHAVRYYHHWKGDDARQWSHWSARYIDYFGPRTFIPVGTSFS